MNSPLATGIRLIIGALWLTSCTYLTQQEVVTAPNDGRSIAATGMIVDGSGYEFNPQDTSCGGFPRLKVQTLPGTCLGMVFSHRNAMGSNGKVIYKMPRTIVTIPGSDDFLVADMGGWTDKAGGLFWIHRENGKYSLVKVLSQLDYAHGLAFNERDQYFYLGEKNRIFRFHFANGQVTDREIVIDNMPDTAKHMHPLTHFVFDPATGDLYMNSGAPTDVCYHANGNYKERCPEETIQKMATIQKISAARLAALPAKGLGADAVEVVAYGLRNSMAMAIHPTGRFLIQGENSRDFPELEEPYEEMNVIRLDQPDVVKHYGWPYCYNNHGASPEWEKIMIRDKEEYEVANQSETQKIHGANPFYCGRQAIQGLKEYQRPYSLIPPHAAPLFASYYTGDMFADLFGGDLLMSWHGHRSTGQRFVSYDTLPNGLPKLKKAGDEFYNFNLPDGCPKPAPFIPRGGFRKHFAPYQEVISGWGPIAGVRPKGAPTGFTVASDGSIWIVEDKNKTIVRLARTDSANFQQNCNATPGQNKDLNVPLLVWRNALSGSDAESVKWRSDYQAIATTLRQQKYCLNCHEALLNKDLNETPDEFSTLDFFVRSQWLKPGDPERSLLYGALTGNGMAPAMPPAGYSSLKDDAAGQALLVKIKEWITGLPKNISERSAQIVLAKNSNIRRTPGTAQKACGQFKSGDIAYIDPRPNTWVSAEGFKWAKVYLVPGHSRLSPSACPQPLDGVFYIAR